MPNFHTNSSKQLPRPSSTHATCAWCHCDFTSIVALLAHVDQGHVTSKAA